MNRPDDSFYLIFIQVNLIISSFLLLRLIDLGLGFLPFRINFKVTSNLTHELLISSIFIKVIIVTVLIYFLVTILKINAMILIFFFFNYIKQLAVLFDRF